MATSREQCIDEAGRVLALALAALSTEEVAA